MSEPDREKFEFLVGRLAFDFRSEAETETLHKAIIGAYDALQARVKQVVEEGRAISRLNVQQAVEIGGLQARVRELDEVVTHYETCDEHRRKEWQADLDRLHQAEAENAALRAELAHSREREEMHSQLRQGSRP